MGLSVLSTESEWKSRKKTTNGLSKPAGSFDQLTRAQSIPQSVPQSVSSALLHGHRCWVTALLPSANRMVQTRPLTFSSSLYSLFPHSQPNHQIRSASFTSKTLLNSNPLLSRMSPLLIFFPIVSDTGRLLQSLLTDFSA